MAKQLSPTTHVSACGSSSSLGLLLATEAWATKTCQLVRGLILFIFSSHWADCLLLMANTINFIIGYLVPFPLLSRAELSLLVHLGFSAVNKLSLLLLPVFASSAATLASNFLALSWVLSPWMNLASDLSSWHCYFCATNIEPYSYIYETTEWKSFLYLSGCALSATTAVDILSHLILSDELSLLGLIVGTQFLRVLDDNMVL